MTDLSRHPGARTLGAVLPAIISPITATASPAPSTSGSLAVRLTDSQLAAAEVVAAAPLPALVQADGQFFAKCLRMLDALPRQKTDTLGGELRVRAYEIAIGHRPKEAIEFLVTEALRNCKFFPSTSECNEILSRWERNDDALRAKRQAETAVRREKEARFDELMGRLAAGEVDQAEIDAMPVRWREIAETRSLLRREADGSYTLRLRREAAA